LFGCSRIETQPVVAGGAQALVHIVLATISGKAWHTGAAVRDASVRAFATVQARVGETLIRRCSAEVKLPSFCTVPIIGATILHVATGRVERAVCIAVHAGSMYSAPPAAIISAAADAI
jgi:hypothetical protein